jgi:hypothetical protein
VLRIFIALKNPSTSAGFEPAKLGSSGITLSIDYRGRLIIRSKEIKESFSISKPLISVVNRFLKNVTGKGKTDTEVLNPVLK